MAVDLALVYPPTCDPTAPYLAVPTLTAWLRREGLTVLPIDANVEAWDFLLTRERLAPLAGRLHKRLDRLEHQPRLSHVEQLAYVALWQARGDAETAPAAIDAAVAVLRDRARFYDPPTYHAAIATVESALRLVGAAHTPLTISFTAYRTPFSFLTPEAIVDDARAGRDPFHDYFASLVPRLAGARVVGISVAFPGQLQPAYSLAYRIARELPDVHLTIGGPAVTQLLTRLSGERLARALGPFHSAILFEGEIALTELVRAPRPGVIRGEQIEDMGRLPAPDFDGLPLAKYFTPELVLPYDPTRGCYWGKCTFCHYGLAEVGTAAYRERPVASMMAHLGELASRHQVSRFYFSQDSVSPKTALRLAHGIREAGQPWTWATDMRPEKSLTAERCAELRAGGNIAMAYGVESAAPRVLQLIDKGVPVDTVETAIRNLASAGVAVEAMCFTDFPTETAREALATIDLLRRLREHVALFICGEFDLTHGALVAQRPADFGIAETWQLDGDELGLGLFYEERRPAKSDASGPGSTASSASCRHSGDSRATRGPAPCRPLTPSSGTSASAPTSSSASPGAPAASSPKPRRGPPPRASTSSPSPSSPTSTRARSGTSWCASGAPSRPPSTASSPPACPPPRPAPAACATAPAGRSSAPASPKAAGRRTR